MADRTSRARRHRLRRWATVIAVIVVIGGVGGGVLAATAASGGPSYRTTAVTHRTVEATLNSIGTVTPVSQASVSFPVSGRVTQVPVAVGQHVATGDVLAELDTSSLTASLDNARSTLASAQAKLAADQSSQTAVGTASTSAPTSVSAGTGGVSEAVFVTSGQAGVQSAGHVTASGTAAGQPQAGTTNSAGTTGGANSAEDLVKHYQQQLLTDQHAADTILYQTQADLAHEQSVCRSFLDSLGRAGNGAPGEAAPGAAHGSGNPGEVTGTPAPTPSAETAAAKGPALDGTDCPALLKQVLTEQETLNDRLRAVSTDVTALDAAVAQLLAQSPGRQQPPAEQPGGSSGGQPGTGTDAGRPPSSPTGTGAGTGGTNGTAGTGSGGSKTAHGGMPADGSATGRSGTASGGSAGGRSGTASGASHAPASAAQIAADQASVDAANATLLVAQQSLDQARLISPISGLVAAVNITPGQSVSGGSSTATIVVLNPGAMQITTTVSDSNVADVKIGAKVAVTPDGTNSPLAGTVVAIGLLPAASTTSGGTASSESSGGVAYPVTVGLNTGGGQLFASSGAAVSIVVSSAANALAVPTSAVLRVGNRHVVSVLRDGKVTSLPVEVGAVGATFTQVTSGLSAGDRVVLADLKAPLPTSNNTLRGLGGAGRSGIGTAGGGGFVGGGGGFTVSGGGGGRNGG